eukprot:scaffold95298_cov42-Prasinocladus_malaysianus.AAC.2
MEPTAPAAPDTTKVSPFFGLQILIVPWNAVRPMTTLHGEKPCERPALLAVSSGICVHKPSRNQKHVTVWKLAMPDMPCSTQSAIDRAIVEIDSCR